MEGGGRRLYNPRRGDPDIAVHTTHTHTRGEERSSRLHQRNTLDWFLHVLNIQDFVESMCSKYSRLKILVF